MKVNEVSKQTVKKEVIIDHNLDDQNTTYFIVKSQPDKLGRQQFTVYWWGYSPSMDKDIWRAQVFYANLVEHVKHSKENLGKKVIIRYKEGIDRT